MDSQKQGTRKTVVRLLPEDRAKRPSAPRVPTLTKLVIRLLPPLNEHVRTELRYRGDLSKMIVEAIDSVDLKSVGIVDLSWETRLEATMISLPKKTHADLKALSKVRAVSMNVLVNTAVAHWLAGKGIIKLA